MNYALFIGNGLNRLDKNFYSWEKLLVEAGLPNEYIEDEIPNTISFEMLTKQAFLVGNTNETIDQKIDASKRDIARLIGQFELSDTSKESKDIRVRIFKELNPTVVMTTNYDYLLENGYRIANDLRLDDTSIEKQYTKENKYNLRRYIELNKTKFYHVHGELNKPHSIVLGYEHYVGTVENMRKRRNPDEKKNCNEVFIPEKNIDKVKEGDQREFDFWMNYFFCVDVHIIGFSLGFAEIDLWWLIVYRSYLIDIGNLDKNNRIYYYDINNKDDAKRKVLEKFNIDYVEIDLNSHGDYLKGYNDIIDAIKSNVQ